MCVCVCVCVYLRLGQILRDVNSVGLFHFLTGRSGPHHQGAPFSLPGKKKENRRKRGERAQHWGYLSALIGAQHAPKKSHNLKLHILTCLLWFRPAVRPWRLFWLISVSCISSSCAPAPTCRQQPGCSSSPPGYQEEDLGQRVPPPPIALLSLTPPCSSSVLSASILPSRVPLPCLSLSDLWVTNIRHSTSPLFVLCLSFFLFCFLIYSLHQIPCSRWVFSWCSISVVVITGGEA